MTAAGILIAILLFGLRIAAHFSQREAEQDSAWLWSAFAQRHGMNCDGLFIHGTFKGYPLTIDTHERRIGRGTYALPMLHLRLPALSHRTELKRGGLLDGPVRVLNATPSEETLLKHPRVQQCLSNVAGAYRDFYTLDGFLHAEQLLLVKREEDLESFLAPALELARALDEAARPPHG